MDVQCSIIIPAFNRVDLTAQCLRAIIANTSEIPYEVIIVDNGSTDATPELCTSLGGNATVIRNDHNRGFAVACNQGARAAASNRLLFLNTDTEPFPGWLPPAMRVLAEEPDVAAVGMKLLFADRTVQHAGVVLIEQETYPTLTARHEPYKVGADDELVNQRRDVSAVTAASVLVRAEHFFEVGGFDEGYWNGYEDVDLCLQFRAAGWRIVYEPESVVLHHESASGPERFSAVEQNVRRLQDKWAAVTTPDVVVAGSGTRTQGVMSTGSSPTAVLTAGPLLVGATPAATAKADGDSTPGGVADHPGQAPAQTVAIVGMHRSGTSLITRIANLVGVHLGPDDQLMPPHAADNPTGYWENAHIVELNNRLLSALGGAWDRPPLLADGWQYRPAIAALRSAARGVMSSSLSRGTTVGWKDPRTSLLLPFWQTVVPVTATVVVVRHPFQVAASLAKRDGIKVEDAAQLWSRYMVAAWRSHANRLVVNYDSALADPALCGVHLANFLGFDEPSAEVLRQISSFVDPGLRHHTDEVVDAGPNMALALAIYAILESQPFPMIDRVFDAIHQEWLAV